MSTKKFSINGPNISGDQAVRPGDHISLDGDSTMPIYAYTEDETPATELLFGEHWLRANVDYEVKKGEGTYILSTKGSGGGVGPSNGKLHVGT